MRQYLSSLSLCQQLCKPKESEKEMKVRSIKFRDGERVCQLLMEHMRIEWEDTLALQRSLEFEKCLSGRKERDGRSFLVSL